MCVLGYDFTQVCCRNTLSLALPERAVARVGVGVHDCGSAHTPGVSVPMLREGEHTGEM